MATSLGKGITKSKSASKMTKMERKEKNDFYMQQLFFVDVVKCEN